MSTIPKLMAGVDLVESFARWHRTPLMSTLMMPSLFCHPFAFISLECGHHGGTDLEAATGVDRKEGALQIRMIFRGPDKRGESL